MPHIVTFQELENDDTFVFRPEQTESQDATEFVGSSGAIGEYDTGSGAIIPDPLTGTSPGESATPGSGSAEPLPPLPYDNGWGTQDLVGLSETGDTDSFDGLF
jgi:hypothetical protein